MGPLITLVLMAKKRTTHEVTLVGRSQPRKEPVTFIHTMLQEFIIKTNWKAGSYASLRNLLVGPVTEEVVFRGCSVPLLLGAGVKRGVIIWLSPLIFGIAHLHHAYEWIRQGRRLANVAVAVAFQMTYTSIFGAYAVFIHLRTGHLLSSVLVHSFCNLMGIPDLSFNNPPGDPEFSSPTSVLHGTRTGLWCAYGTGVILFGCFLFPLTSPSLYGGSLLWHDLSMPPGVL
ncbi:unnamed protein product [Choristocarpus tenellus]